MIEKHRAGGFARALGAAAVACSMLFACGGTGEEVVEEPVPMPGPMPIEYPLALWDQKVQGEAQIMIHVNELGDVDSALVSQTSGYAEFDSAAVNGARQLRFTPGSRNGHSVAMWTKIPVRFSQDSTAEIGASTGSGITTNN